MSASIEDVGGLPGGSVLRDFLDASHNDDGSLVTSAVQDAVGGSMTASGTQVFSDLAALLDPAAYVLVASAGFPITVPDDTTWYSLNLWYGFVVDRTVTDLATTNNSKTVTSATASFTSADVGRIINVPSQSSFNQDLSTGNHIVSVDSATQVTMYGNAHATASGLTAKIGSYKFHRDAHAGRALPLPAGTVLNGTVSPMPATFAYICKPELVNSDARYTSDPEALYYSRLAQLRTMTQYDLTVALPYGSAEASIGTQSFPSDFTNGIVALVSVNEGSWLTLNGTNVWNEVSDDHQMRYGLTTLLPFQRATFPNIQVRAGNVSGDTVSTSKHVTGAVSYYKLPEGW